MGQHSEGPQLSFLPFPLPAFLQYLPLVSPGLPTKFSPDVDFSLHSRSIFPLDLPLPPSLCSPKPSLSHFCWYLQAQPVSLLFYSFSHDSNLVLPWPSLSHSCQSHSLWPSLVTHVSQQPTPTGCRQVQWKQSLRSQDSPRVKYFPS